MLQVLWSVAVLSFIGVLLAQRASMVVWCVSYAVVALLILKYAALNLLFQGMLFIGFALFAAMAITPLRRQWLSRFLFDKARAVMPGMSSTEREALEAGSIGWEAALFSGAPDFTDSTYTVKPSLSKDEQAFLEGPLKTLCAMIDDWDITHNRTDLPPKLWQYLKEQKFLGLIIPELYGGRGFSATAVMSVLVTLYGRSISVATTVAVPNSLGPAELLLKYGTESQKAYYLPRLAEGLEIPCFALTAPNAGSDAASIPDTGVVCRQVIDGESVLGMRLNWDKRYITLCPAATVIGLAFRLFDPENWLGKGHDIGISCALIPADTPGVETGRRHFPLNSAFLNGPTRGKDVFVPLDCLIGGEAMAGQGWRMLMECLSAGRAISLPSSASGGAQAVAMASGAYARVRKQFNQPVAKFEGIEEALARIAGKTYMIQAALSMTAAAVDHGVKSAVAGAILKYHTTEWARQVIIDAMDIHGGKGICLGPENYLGRGYQGAPISITVEGANILTRSLIIFGQGAVRCHPYVLAELESLRDQNLAAFDEAIGGHVSFALSNLTRSFVFSFTNARGSAASTTQFRSYYQAIYRYSTNLAFLADFSLLTLGASLKRKESISARLGDMLSYLYIASAVLHRFEQEGSQKEDRPLVDWCCQYLLYECESAMCGIMANFPYKWARIVLKILLQPLGRRRKLPSDKLGQTLARILTQPNKTRDRLTHAVFSDPGPYCPLGRLEAAFHELCSVESLERKVAHAVRENKLQGLTLLDQIEEAESKGTLSVEEAEMLRHAEQARQAVIAVDDFSNDMLARTPLENLSEKKQRLRDEANPVATA